MVDHRLNNDRPILSFLDNRPRMAVGSCNRAATEAGPAAIESKTGLAAKPGAVVTGGRPGQDLLRTQTR